MLSAGARWSPTHPHLVDADTEYRAGIPRRAISAERVPNGRLDPRPSLCNLQAGDPRSSAPGQSEHDYLFTRAFAVPQAKPG